MYIDIYIMCQFYFCYVSKFIWNKKKKKQN